MKTILVVHDSTFTDVDKMMRNIDYVSQTSQAPFSTENFPEEPDYVISFIYDLHDGSETSELAMNQWRSKRPVFAFQVLKP